MPDKIFMKAMITDFFSLIYPSLCFACDRTLYKHEQSVCTLCRYHLPKTNYHLDNVNPLSKLFWGRVDIKSASAFYHFDKGSKVQNLIHHLKYKGQKEIGNALGFIYGKELLKSENYEKIDLVVPVPLHPKKLKKRGYNQSDYFAMGLAKALKTKWLSDGLLRTSDSKSQTLRSRFDRWQNLSSVFGMRNPQNFDGMNVLIADDVITTGSTLEACAELLLLIPGVKVSVAAIACTR